MKEKQDSSKEIVKIAKKKLVNIREKLKQMEGHLNGSISGLKKKSCAELVMLDYFIETSLAEITLNSLKDFIAEERGGINNKNQPKD